MKDTLKVIGWWLVAVIVMIGVHTLDHNARDSYLDKAEYDKIQQNIIESYRRPQ